MFFALLANSFKAKKYLLQSLKMQQVFFFDSN